MMKGLRGRGRGMRITAVALAAAVLIGSVDANMLYVQAANEGEPYVEEQEFVEDYEELEEDDAALVQDSGGNADATESEEQPDAAGSLPPEGLDEDGVETASTGAINAKEPEDEPDDAESKVSPMADGDAGDGSEEKPQPQEVTISGVAVSNKTYDGKPVTFCKEEVKATVTVKVDDTEEERDVTSEVGFKCSVSGSNKNNEKYEKSCEITAGTPSSSIAAEINNILPTEAGSYMITVTVSGDADKYKDKGAIVDRIFYIDQRPITITADSKEIIVGGEKPEYSYKVEGLVEGEELQKKEDLSFDDSSVNTDKIFSYPIGIMGTEDLAKANYNYKITYQNGLLVVRDKMKTVISGIDIQGKEYDGTPVVSSGTLSVTAAEGDDSGQNITADMEIVCTVTGTDTSGNQLKYEYDYHKESEDSFQMPLNAGTYKFTVTASNAKYKGTLIRDINIAQKQIVIKPNDVTVSEDAKIPTFTYGFVGDGLVGTDSIVKEPRLTCETDRTDKPGTYTITAKDASAGNNYTIKYETGTLTVLEKDRVAISGITVSGKIYDGKQVEHTIEPRATVGQGKDVTSEVEFSYRIEGIQADGDSYLWTGTSDDIESGMPADAGEYTLTVTVSDKVSDGNPDAVQIGKYKGTKTYNFEILPRKIVVKAKDMEIRTEDQVPMEFEYDVDKDVVGGDGFLEGDGFEKEPQFFCEIENTDQPGSYVITVFGARAEANYLISYINGTLTVIEKEIEKTKDLVRIIAPDPVINIKNGTAIADIALPKTVKVITRNFGADISPDTERTETAQVEWVRQAIGGTSYRPGYKEEQIFLLAGNVAVPPDVEPGSIPTVTTVWVTVCEEWVGDAVATPTASIASGDRVQSGTMLELQCATEDATIYYTIDGSVPTKPTKETAPDGSVREKKSVAYSAPIELNEHTSVIRAYAVKKGYPDSTYAKFVYFIGDASSGEDDPDQPEVPKEDIPDDGKIPEGLWSTKIQDYVYTGKAIKPVVRVYDYKTLLEEKKDYTIAYKNNVNAANKAATKAPSLIITGKGNYEGKITKTFTIAPKNIADRDVIIDDVAVLSNGKAQKPVPSVVWNGKKLKNKKDYTVQDISYTEIGSYTVNVTGSGNYTGEKSFAFTITDGVLVSKLTVSKIPDQVYTGEEIKPTLTVKDKGTALSLNQNYTVTYADNREVGTATAVIKGSGSYVGTKRVTFKIKAVASLSKAKIEPVFASTDLVYTGESITAKSIKVTLSVKGADGNATVRELSENTDFEVSYKNNDRAGTATILLTGKGAYSGTAKKTFKINALDIGSDQIKIGMDSSYSYVKGGCKAEPAIKFGKKKLVAGRDYTLSYKQNNAAGSTAVVTIKGKGNYTGSKAMTYMVTAQDIGKMKVSAADKAYQNKGNIYKTAVRVTDTNGKALSAGKDYDKDMAYTYADNSFKKAGTPVMAEDVIPAGTPVSVTVTARGNDYTGTVTGTYRIVATSIAGAKVTVPVQTYTGKAIEPGTDVVKVEIKGALLSDSDYEIVEYSNNVKKGTAKLVIHGLGNYGGTKTVSFKIKGKGLFDLLR